MRKFPLVIMTAGGRRIALAEDDWLHIPFKHPEVGDDPAVLMQVVREPGELYRDPKGGLHAIRQVDALHFLVVICEVGDSEGYKRTSDLISERRRKRRYRAFRSLQRF